MKRKEPTLFDTLTLIAVISAFGFATGLAWLLLEVYYAFK